jgi:acyl-CoA dehydrogenase
MHEILGSTPIAPFAFGNQAPDSGNSEILALAGTDEQKDRWLYPLLNGDLHSAFSMTEPDVAARTRRRCARARSRTATATSSPATSGSPPTPRSPTS